MQNYSLEEITIRQLKRAIVIKGKIAALQSELDDLLAIETTRGSSRRRGIREKSVGGQVKRKGRMSRKARARIAAAARARWAKVKSAGRNSL